MMRSCGWLKICIYKSLLYRKVVVGVTVLKYKVSEIDIIIALLALYFGLFNYFDHIDLIIRIPLNEHNPLYFNSGV